MAKETYIQLNNQKKDRIMQAIMNEFSESSFSQASINRIIKEAGISRGSFYQYFEDKEDCYLEMLGVIAEEKMKIFKEIVQIDPNATLFEHYIQMIKQIQIWMEMRPQYFKISMLMDLDNSEFIQKLIDKNPSLMDYFIHLIKRDIERNIIKSNVDPYLLCEVLIAINKAMLLDTFQNKDYKGMVDKSNAILDLLKYGTLNSKGEKHV